MAFLPEVASALIRLYVWTCQRGEGQKGLVEEFSPTLILEMRRFFERRVSIVECNEICQTSHSRWILQKLRVVRI